MKTFSKILLANMVFKQSASLDLTINKNLIKQDFVGPLEKPTNFFNLISCPHKKMCQSAVAATPTRTATLPHPYMWSSDGLVGHRDFISR